MSWAERIKDWARGDAPLPTGVDLAALCADLDREATRLARHADLAPNEAAESELDRLAADIGEVGHQLRTAVGATLEAVSAAGEDEGAVPSGLNHWARLVRDLQNMRSARDRLFDAAKDLDSIDPDLSAVLDRLAREVEVRVSRVRALIARADPQSLD